MGRRAAHEIERCRIRGLLDQHAAWLALGVAKPDSLLIRKTLKDLESIQSRAHQLDGEFWAQLFEATDA
jgi:hypothetical protein